MIDAEPLTFTDSEITRQALTQSSALTYLMVAYARECGKTPAHVAEFAGRIFAKGWSRHADLDALGIARNMALIMLTIGGDDIRITGDSLEAEVRASGVVTDEEAQFFGVTRDDADQFCNVFGPMVSVLGFRFSWRRDGDDLVYRVRRTAF